MNTFGNILRLTSFGESHGPAMGGILDGLPSRCTIRIDEIQAQLERRAPGRSPLTSARREPDRVEFLSGLMAYDEATGDVSAFTPDTRVAVTLGTPVAFVIRNNDSRSADYDTLRHIYRPSHADFAWQQRYDIRDWRGGGRSSGRETVSRVVAGAIARRILAERHITVSSRIACIAGVENPAPQQVQTIIQEARDHCNSVGGVVECIVDGLPPGIGNPVFDKLDAMLASAMLSIGAVKGVEFGMGFQGCSRRGSEVADFFVNGPDGAPCLRSNFSGGIQGGITNGMPLVMRVAVKPTPSIARELGALTDTGQIVAHSTKGRHDPCILPRVLPVVEAMAALTLLDAMLMSSSHIAPPRQ